MWGLRIIGGLRRRTGRGERAGHFQLCFGVVTVRQLLMQSCSWQYRAGLSFVYLSDT